MRVTDALGMESTSPTNIIGEWVEAGLAMRLTAMSSSSSSFSSFPVVLPHTQHVLTSSPCVALCCCHAVVNPVGIPPTIDGLLPGGLIIGPYPRVRMGAREGPGPVAAAWKRV